MVAVPLYIRHNIQYREGSGGRFEVTIGPKQTMGKVVSHWATPCNIQLYLLKKNSDTKKSEFSILKDLILM